MFPIHSRKTKPLSAGAGILAMVFLVISLVAVWEVQAKPTTTAQAQGVVEHWLALDEKPLGCALGYQVREVQPFTDNAGQPLYFIVYLKPTGFVIVSGDDLVEPIIGFLSHGRYDPSPANPLGALVSRDVPGRVAQARKLEEMVPGEGLDTAPLERFSPAKRKWEFLLQAAPAALPGLDMGLPTVSDICVAPLVQSKWDQTSEGTGYCYNYYTPNHYPCGCVATAMAQLMRYWEWPLTGVGTPSFWYKVDDILYLGNLRGGDGAGGPYDWDNMVLDPDESTTNIERQAIGNLTRDAGYSVNMEYAAAGSGSNTLKAATALVDTFGYGNAKKGENGGYNIPTANLNHMVNPNLDAAYPVLLGIEGYDPVTQQYYGHAVVTDGYGYNLATLYHHLNMGDGGIDDAWYNLPNVDSSPSYSSVYRCVYNIYPSGSGEIISGRVVDYDGEPLGGAWVTATITGGDAYNTTSNGRGIYVFPRVPSATEYTITCDTLLYGSRTKVVRTGTSTNGSVNPGNVWGVDFGPWKWSFETGDVVWSSPAIGPDRTIYVGSNDNKLYAINPDGSKKWEFATGENITHSPTVGPNGIIYVGSDDTYLYAVNPDGTQKWAFKMGLYFNIAAAAIGPDGTIYAGNMDRHLYAINPDGTQKWVFPIFVDWDFSSPAIGPDGTIYVGADDYQLYALNPSGKKKWAFSTGNVVGSSPAIGADGTIYVGSGDGYLYAVNPDGSQKWAYKTAGMVFSSPAIGPDGTIYVGSGDHYLHAINPDGTGKWTANTYGAILYSSPAIGADGTIYVGSEYNYLFAINPDGTRKWMAKTGGYVNSSPVIGPDGTGYVGSHDHNLYAFPTSSQGLAKSRWPMFHRDARHTGCLQAIISPVINLLLGD